MEAQRAVSRSGSTDRNGRGRNPDQRSRKVSQDKRKKKNSSLSGHLNAVSLPALQRNYHFSFDFTLIFIVAILLVFGLIMVYSSSSYSASLLDDGDPAFYLKRQFVAMIGGIIAMFVCAQIRREHWYKVALFAYGFALFMVLITPIVGKEINHAKRWIYIGPISIQPSELMKIGVILLLSRMIADRGRMKLVSFRGVLPIMGTAAIPAAMVWILTSNLSSGIIVFGIAFIMLFVASPNYKVYLLIVGSIIGSVCLLVWYAQNYSLDFLGYRGARIVSWLNPAADSSGSGFQTLQALYAIGSGGFAGKGLGHSMQKLGFLPEAQNDMIFSIICEELGLVGAITIMVLFLALIIKIIGIASRVDDLFEMMIVTGVAAHMALQVLFNIAVVTNTIPNTGISLPFISYGGSAVLCQLAEIGMVLGIERRSARKNL